MKRIAWSLCIAMVVLSLASISLLFGAGWIAALKLAAIILALLIIALLSVGSADPGLTPTLPHPDHEPDLVTRVRRAGL